MIERADRGGDGASGGAGEGRQGEGVAAEEGDEGEIKQGTGNREQGIGSRE